MRAVRGDVQAVRGQTVVRKSGVERALTAGIPVGIDANRCAVVVRLVRRSVFDAEAGHNFDVLGGVTPYLNEVLQFLGFQRKRLFTGVQGRDGRVLFRRDLDGCSRASNRKHHVTVAPLAASQADVIRFVCFEPSSFHSEHIGSDRNRRKCVVALGICHRIAGRARHGVLQHNLGGGYHRPRGVCHSSRQSRENALSPQREPVCEQNQTAQNGETGN